MTSWTDSHSSHLVTYCLTRYLKVLMKNFLSSIDLYIMQQKEKVSVNATESKLAHVFKLPPILRHST